MLADSPITYLLTGAFFGLSAGISPGPLLTLVISETLKHTRKEGFKIAVSPLITDLPIILITYFIFEGMSEYDISLAVISFLGGIYLAYLGLETILMRQPATDFSQKEANSLRKGIIANFLNPNPYIFWFTAGIPTAFKALRISLVTAVLFFLSFYVFLVGSKILTAILVERSRNFLRTGFYRILMIILGAVLLLFALIFIRDGLRIIS